MAGKATHELETRSDDVLSRAFGGNLQAATLRLALSLAIACAVVATIVVLV